MILSRRTLMSIGFAALATPSVARAQTASRRYRLDRAGSEIGTHDISIGRSGDTLTVDVSIAIAVRVLGLVAYRYEMTSREIWQNGMLRSIRSRSDNNGDAAFVNADRSGSVIRIDGSAFSGTADADVGTTSYWNPAILDRPVWISTQGGTPLDIRATRTGTASYPVSGGTVATTAYALGAELPATVHYTASGEWAGSTFDARGSQVTYIADSLSPALAAIWSES